MAETVLYKIALNKAMNQCSRREYCSDEIRRKLLAWNVENSEAEKILSILYKENYINDLRYAKAFVRDKFNLNKWGKVKLSVYLRKKNIPANIIRLAIDSIDNEAYLRLLKNLIADHRKSVKAKNQFEMKAKLLRYGLSKGFESSLLYDLLNEIDD